MSTSSKAAFSLVETLFAMVIVAVAVTTSMAALAAGTRNHSMTRDRQVAAQIAQYALEDFYFQRMPASATTRPDLECALVAGSSFAQVPVAIAARLVSESGDLERVVGSGGPLFYLKPSGRLIDRSQTRLVFAVVTPAVCNGGFTGATSAPAGVPPGGAPPVPFESATTDGTCSDWTVVSGQYLQTYKLRPDLQARTLVAWSADWYQYQDCESPANGGDHNGNGVIESGPLPSSSRLPVRELARFNFYDPRFPISLEQTP
jgi:hypothetical protein